MWLRTSPDGNIDYTHYRPSNIDTWYRQKYFHKTEDDFMLNTLIDIFKENWNTREIDNKVFEENILAIKSVSKNSNGGLAWVLLWEHVLARVYDETIEVVWDKVKLRDYVIQHLLKYNYQRSPRTVVARISKNLLNNLKTNN